MPSADADIGRIIAEYGVWCVCVMCDIWLLAHSKTVSEHIIIIIIAHIADGDLRVKRLFRVLVVVWLFDGQLRCSIGWMESQPIEMNESI